MAIDRLSALDRLMLWASRRWPQDVGALAIIEGDPLLDAVGRLRMDLVRDVVGRRLPLVPRFRQLIHAPRRGLGGPVWVDAPAVDLTHHVRELVLEPEAGEPELLAAVEQLLQQRLDPSRPLWEMWFLTGLRERRIGLFVRIHHAVADGMAAMATIETFLDPRPATPAVAAVPWNPAPWPSAQALVTDNLARRLHGLARTAVAVVRTRRTLRRVRAAWPAIREVLAEEPATATSLDRVVGPRRRLALIRTSLDAVKEVGRLHDATVTDVVLAVTAAGLRAVLQGRGERVAGTTIRIYVPVSLRRRVRGPQHGNLIAQMAVPLQMGDVDPDRRLRQVAAETARRKSRARTSLETLLHGRLLRRVMLMAVMRQRVNATTASIPGPTRPLYLAGARLLEAFPVLPLVANQPLGVGALSYAGALSIGVSTDRDAFPDLDAMLGAMRAELHALGLPAWPALDWGHEGARIGDDQGTVLAGRAISQAGPSPSLAPLPPAPGAAPCR